MLDNPYDNAEANATWHIVRERLRKELRDKHKPTSNPIGIMLGGQPASGKTSLIQHILKNVYPSKNFKVINGDEYRAFHPHFHKIEIEHGNNAANFTQSFANNIATFLRKTCLENKIDFIVEGTLRTFEVPKSTTEELLSNGFSAELHVLFVNYEESLLGIFNRYEKDIDLTGKGRFSPLASHDEAYRAVPLNCNAFISEFANKQATLTIYRRTKDGLLGKKITCSEDIEELSKLREIPSVSAAYLFQSWQNIYEMAKLREEENEEYLTLISNQISKYSPNH